MSGPSSWRAFFFCALETLPRLFVTVCTTLPFSTPWVTVVVVNLWFFGAFLLPTAWMLSAASWSFFGESFFAVFGRGFAFGFGLAFAFTPVFERGGRLRALVLPPR